MAGIPISKVKKIDLYYTYSVPTLAGAETLRGRLTAEAYQALMDARPWDQCWNKRGRQVTVVDPDTMTDAALAFLEDEIRWMFKYRQEIWERRHWLSLSSNADIPWMAKAYTDRKSRSKPAREQAQQLLKRGKELIVAKELPVEFFDDPALWYWNSENLIWIPDSNDLVEALAHLDAADPLRNFCVDAPLHHPFYAATFALDHPRSFPMPSTSDVPDTVGEDETSEL